VRGKSAQHLNSTRFFSHTHRPTVFRHRLWRSFLQHSPDRIANHVFFASQSRIPEAEHLDAASLKPFIPFGVAFQLFGRPMLETVQLNIQHGFNAKEIQHVRRIRMFTPELISGKPTISKPSPQQLLGPRIIFAQCARNTRELCRRCHLGYFEEFQTAVNF